MNKKIKVGISLLLCILLIFSFAACNKPGDDEVSEVTDTTEVFVLNGACDYQILLSASPSYSETYAAGELQKYFASATGAMLTIAREPDADATLGKKLISIGRTALLEQSGVIAKSTDLNTDGFKIVTKEKAVLLVGGNDDGTLYAVYEFLTRYVEFEAYSVDEVYYKQSQNLNLKKFNLTSIPDFAKRVVYFKLLNTYTEARGLLRTHDNAHWGLFGHSYFRLIPPGDYQTSKPEWFWPRTGTPQQLCMTADGLVDEVIKNLKAAILSRPDCEYFMIGQEDTNTACDCGVCHTAKGLYGGNSGVMMVFTNKIARAIKQWQAETCPERQIYLGTFAYQKTKAAPVKINPETKEYEPFHPDVVAEDNLLVQYAPLEACYSHTLMEECNASFREGIKGWRTVSKKYAIWTYSTNFTNYLMNFNNFSTIKDNYLLFKDMGAQAIMDQGTGETQGSPFHELRCYVQAKLLWDTDLDPNVLIDNFLRQYYKVAYPEIREYFDLMRLHYMSLDTDNQSKEKGEFHTYIYNTFGISNEKSEYWPKTLVEQGQRLLGDALSKVLQEYTGEIQETMRIRILRETFNMRYFDLQMYSGYYSKEEIKGKIDSFESDAYDCNLVCWQENTPLNGKLTEWRTRLL